MNPKSVLYSISSQGKAQATSSSSLLTFPRLARLHIAAAQESRFLIAGCKVVGTNAPELPTELLCEIFALATCEIGPYREIQSILNVALVCRGWRDVVFSEPSLWRSFQVTIRIRYPNRGLRGEQPKTLFPGVQKWYRRARGLPLALRLHFGGHQIRDVTPIVDLVLSFDTWDTLSVLDEGSDYAPSGDKWPFRLLCSLSLARDFKGRDSLKDL